MNTDVAMLWPAELPVALLLFMGEVKEHMIVLCSHAYKIFRFLEKSYLYQKLSSIFSSLSL